MTIKIKHTFRQSKQYSKGFYTRLCEQFVHSYIPESEWPKFSIAEFTKNDKTGTLSIIFYNQYNQPFDVMFFDTMPEMRSFMEGFLEGFLRGNGVEADYIKLHKKRD